MLHLVSDLLGFGLAARDGDIGKVKDAYFDDERWALRHLVVDTGGWLGDRKVLISPRSVRLVDWNDRAIEVDLTRQQVKDGPDIDMDMPVSRQHEIEYHRYFGYPNYWDGANLWGPTVLPYPYAGVPGGAPWLGPEASVDREVAREIEGRLTQERASADVHLRSCEEVTGYEILATDGSIGKVDDFVFDDASFAIAFLVVDTRKWLPGKHVRLRPQDIARVSWNDREVTVKMTRSAVEASPEFDEAHPGGAPASGQSARPA
jgi:uncharacterized protein YrrD